MQTIMAKSLIYLFASVLNLSEIFHKVIYFVTGKYNGENMIFVYSWPLSTVRHFSILFIFISHSITNSHVYVFNIILYL